MSDASAQESPTVGATRTTDETRAIIRSIVGTGIGLATLVLMLAGLMIQQNAALNARISDVNARIGDVNANVNARFDDFNASVNARFDDANASVNTRFDDANTRFDDLRADVAAQFARVNARIDDLQASIRELRALLIDALKRTAPAD